MTVADVLAASHAFRTSHADALVADYMALLAIPNVTGDVAALEANADELVRRFTAVGGTMRTVALPGKAPVVVGRLPAASGSPVLGVYVHYDGQPVNPNHWDSPPFEPEVRNDRIYARGASDDKAPFAAMLGAIQALERAGIERTTELIFLFEGQEESGSPDLREYMTTLRKDLIADLWLICDGPVHPTGRPQLAFGVRGYCGFDLTVYGPERELHSGHFGNWVPNPAHDLARLLATCKDDGGNVLIDGFYDSTRPISDADRAANAALPDVERQFHDDIGFAQAEPADSTYAEELLRPSFNVRGLASGAVGAAARNAIPTEAAVSVDVRLAAGNDPEEMLALVRNHIERQGYTVLDSPENGAGQQIVATLGIIEPCLVSHVDHQISTDLNCP